MVLVCSLHFAEWKISMGHRKPCSASPNTQTGQRRFFHPEEERVPYSGHSAAAEQAVSTARAEEWAIYGRATIVVVHEAMKGLLTWYNKVHVPAMNLAFGKCQGKLAFSMARCFCGSNSPISQSSVTLRRMELYLRTTWVAWAIHRQDHAQYCTEGGTVTSASQWNPKQALTSVTSHSLVSLTASQLSFWTPLVGTWTRSLFPLVARL